MKTMCLPLALLVAACDDPPAVTAADALPAIATDGSAMSDGATTADANITRETADEWMGAGIAETVTTDLKKIHGLTVIGRAQVFEAAKNLLSTSDVEFNERFAIEVVVMTMRNQNNIDTRQIVERHR